MSAPRWTWASTTPGSTWRPETSSVSAAGASAPGSTTPAIRPSWISRSARCAAAGQDDGAAGRAAGRGVGHGVPRFQFVVSGLPTASWRSSQVAIESSRLVLIPDARSSANARRPRAERTAARRWRRARSRSPARRAPRAEQSGSSRPRPCWRPAGRRSRRRWRAAPRRGRRLDEDDVGAGRAVARGALERGVDPVDRASVGAGDDQRVVGAARVERGAELAVHLVDAITALPAKWPHFLGKTWSSSWIASGARALEPAHHVRHVDRVAEAGVGVDDERDVDRVADRGDVVDELSG